MENPIEMDDLGVPLFLETPIFYLLQFPEEIPGVLPPGLQEFREPTLAVHSCWLLVV